MVRSEIISIVVRIVSTSYFISQYTIICFIIFVVEIFYIFNIAEAIDSSDNEELQKLSTMLTEMVGLLRQGDGVLDPNTELSDSKWLQWTPLMCAVAFNDTRTVKYARMFMSCFVCDYRCVNHFSFFIQGLPCCMY